MCGMGMRVAPTTSANSLMELSIMQLFSPTLPTVQSTYLLLPSPATITIPTLLNLADTTKHAPSTTSLPETKPPSFLSDSRIPRHYSHAPEPRRYPQTSNKHKGRGRRHGSRSQRTRPLPWQPLTTPFLKIFKNISTLSFHGAACLPRYWPVVSVVAAEAAVAVAAALAEGPGAV